MSDVVVQLSQLHKQFSNTVAAVRELDLRAFSGEILALLGPSGCGKTTALRLIAGFERPDSGVITVNKKVIVDDSNFVPPEKRGIGMVFQEYALFPHLDVFENISFGLHNYPANEKDEIVEAMLELVGLPGLGERYPHELSGGQRQRVALARALAPQPFLLLLDEPFSNLDAHLRVQMRQEVRDILKGFNSTAIFVTHDQEEALFMGDRVAIMNQGRVEQVGTPEEIFHSPQTRFVAEFLGGTDFLPGVIRSNGVQTELGLIEQPVNLPLGENVEVAVRADDVKIEAAGNGNSVVVERYFLGVQNQYQVQLPSGVKLHALAAHTTQIRPGAAANVEIDPNHSLTVFEKMD